MNRLLSRRSAATRKTAAAPVHQRAVATAAGEGATAPRAPRRLLRVGPGLLLAALASLVLWRLSPPIPDGPAPALPPPAPAQGVAVPPAAPDPDWLFTTRGALGLTPAQERRLGVLHSRWRRDTEPLRNALAQASAEFDRAARAEWPSKATTTANGAAAPRGMTLEDIRQHAGPLSALSRDLADARRSWWEEAATRVLTPAQRERAERAWAERLTPGRKGARSWGK